MSSRKASTKPRVIASARAGSIISRLDTSNSKTFHKICCERVGAIGDGKVGVNFLPRRFKVTLEKDRQTIFTKDERNQEFSNALG